MSLGKLIFFCGKMGAGKTTLSKKIAEERSAILLSEDEWLAALYPGEITTLEQYVTCSSRLKPQIKSLVQSILKSGVDVVMDFPANTQRQRAWFKSIFEPINAPHELILIDVPDKVCLQRIAKRRVEQPERAKTDSPEIFEQVTRYFELPAADEGLRVVNE